MNRAGTIAVLVGVILLGDLVGLATIEPAPTTDVAAPTPDQTPAHDAPKETLDQQLQRVRGHVEAIRGLQFASDPLVRQASREALREDVEAQVSEYTPEQAGLDQDVLVALGQLAAGVDLRALLVTAYGEQVAGYYDPETKELVVGTDDPTIRLGRLDEVTLAHELGHALVDARVGLPDLAGFEDGQQDALLASQALVEGDATLLMNLYVERAMSPIDALLLAREALALTDTLASLEALPYVIRRTLEFPYLDGAAFVQSRHERGGWAAVDALYVDPPTTTLEILDPGRYGEVVPTTPSAPGRPGDAWTLERTLAVGALDLDMLFAAPGDDLSRAMPNGRALALAWTGGALTQWSTDVGDGVAVAMHVRHDPGVAMCDAMQTWYLAAFPSAVSEPTGAPVELAVMGEAQAAVIDCDADEVRVGIAPSIDEANRAIGN